MEHSNYIEYFKTEFPDNDKFLGILCFDLMEVLSEKLKADKYLLVDIVNGTKYPIHGFVKYNDTFIDSIGVYSNEENIISFWNQKLKEEGLTNRILEVTSDIEYSTSWYPEDREICMNKADDIIKLISPPKKIQEINTKMDNLILNE